MRPSRNGADLSITTLGVGRERQDRQGRIGERRVLCPPVCFQRPDPLRGLEAIHDRHLAIHAHQVVALTLHGAHGFEPGSRHVGPEADLRELDGFAEEVGEDLAKARRVGGDRFGQGGGLRDDQLEPLALCRLPEQLDDVFHQAPEVAVDGFEVE